MLCTQPHELGTGVPRGADDRESGLRRARVNEAMAANDADWRLLDGSLRENRAVLAASWNDWQAQQAGIASYRNAEASARSAYEGAILQQRLCCQLPRERDHRHARPRMHAAAREIKPRHAAARTRPRETALPAVRRAAIQAAARAREERLETRGRGEHRGGGV